MNLGTQWETAGLGRTSDSERVSRLAMAECKTLGTTGALGTRAGGESAKDNDIEDGTS